MLQFMKKFMLVFIFFFFFFPGFVQAEDEIQTNEELVVPLEDPEFLESQLDALGISEVSQYWDNVLEEYGGFLPESQKGSFTDFILGKKDFSIQSWFSAALKYMFHEITSNTKLLSMIIMLTLFSVVLQALQNSFDSGNVSKIAYFVVFLVLIALALSSFKIAVDYTLQTIDMMTGFIISLLPLLLALISTSGGILTASFFHPLVIFLMNTSGMLMKSFVLPLLFMSTILSIVSTISENYKVTQLAGLLRNIAVGVLGAFLTIYLTIFSIQGTATAVTDGLGIRTAKFVAGTFIPVVGRLFTDTADTILSASLVLKNTVGIVGVLLIIVIAAFPALQILTIAFIYKFSAAILQPLGGGPLIATLSVISKNIVYIFASLAIVSFMFFLCLTVMIAAGNITVMMR